MMIRLWVVPAGLSNMDSIIIFFVYFPLLIQYILLFLVFSVPSLSCEFNYIVISAYFLGLSDYILYVDPVLNLYLFNRIAFVLSCLPVCFYSFKILLFSIFYHPVSDFDLAVVYIQIQIEFVFIR